MPEIKMLDCTLRDGGYYNAWDFPLDLIHAYMKAMVALPVDMVEIGFRNIPSEGSKFKGGCAYCSDDFIRSLRLQTNGTDLAVMVNGADLLKYPEGLEASVDLLFGPAVDSPVCMVRIACHVDKVVAALPAISRLHDLGYKTTINIMQIAGLSTNKISQLARACSEWPINVLYFADSLGSMIENDINQTVGALKEYWAGELGFHAHNNMERALANCLRAIDQGVTWIDSTVLGMGRGPGNARTEYLAIELEDRLGRDMHHTPLLDLLNEYFIPLYKKYNWGPNPYYYLAGKRGIHPTYIQEMLNDSRYDKEDLLAVIDHLCSNDGKHFNLDNLETARNFYCGEPRGYWEPASMLKGRTILLLGAGPGVVKHRSALENFIRKQKPIVMALNTQSGILSDLIDLRLACHPIRLLADCEDHQELPQPLITPASMLPDDIANALRGKQIYDYGLGVKADTFETFPTYCLLPNSLVVAYALAVSAAGQSERILLAGFDGYGGDDLRSHEMQSLINFYLESTSAIPLVAITPTIYTLPIMSVYML